MIILDLNKIANKYDIKFEELTKFFKFILNSFEKYKYIQNYEFKDNIIEVNLNDSMSWNDCLNKITHANISL